jgi:glycosidase
MMNKISSMKMILLVGTCCLYLSGISQKVYPTNWWIGMKNPNVQLMLHGVGIGKGSTPVATINYTGVKVVKVHKVESDNYLFVDINIASTAKPGNVKINVKQGSSAVAINFPLAVRRRGKGTAFAQGVTSEDFMYLLMPDRFSNGDESNDQPPGMLDIKFNRDSIFHRHGGDIQGIINHLDYLKDLGITAVWPTPVVENNVPKRSEHGYAATNHYVIEPRFGGEQAYKNLSDELHKRGMKLMQDIVPNHVGSHHFTVLDKPMKDWVHQWPKFTRTHHREQAVFDPYAAKQQVHVMLNGWFEPLMPDLNQTNPYVANYLIQNYIWSVEEFGVDGFRVDTYKYNDLDFINKCNKALLSEYPSLSIFGETMAENVLGQAYFTENNLSLPWKSNLPGTIDFQSLWQGITPALNENNEWAKGVIKLYTTLSQDFVYKDPMKNVIILDNHDMTRFFSTVNEDVEKLKIGLAWLLTCRGIPQMYYATEIMTKGVSNPDGLVRLDFPGGWKGDKDNKFTAEGRTNKEQEVFDWTKRLANFRKSSSAIKTGKLMQYIPDDGLYVYFRYDNKQTVMCIMNTSDRTRDIDFTKYAERATGFPSFKNITTNSIHLTADKLTIPAKRMMVLDMMK